MKKRLLWSAVLLLVAASKAPASPPALPFVSASSTVAVQCGESITSLPVTWYFPMPDTSAGLVWLQHGFFRANENVADLASKLARAGFVVVATTIPSLERGCNINNVTTFLPNFAPLFGTVNQPGSALLTSAQSAAATLGRAVPSLPERFVFTGHSAGGSAVTLVAREFVTQFPAVAARLQGLILLDPVENLARSMHSSLPALTSVPILTISAPPQACNANTSGTNALLALGRSFIGVELTSGSHCDAEGASGNPVICGLVCGPVRGENVGVLQILAVGWAADMLRDRTSSALYPGGTFYTALVAAGLVRTL